MKLISFKTSLAELLINRHRIRKLGVFCELGLVYIKNRSFNVFIDREGFAYDKDGNRLKREDLELALGNKGLLRKLMDFVISYFGYSYIDTFMCQYNADKIPDTFVSTCKEAVSIGFIDDTSFVSSDSYSMLFNFLLREKDFILKVFSKDTFSILTKTLEPCLPKSNKHYPIPYFSNTYSTSIGADIFGCDIEYHEDMKLTILRYVRYVKNNKEANPYEFFRIYVNKNKMIPLVKDNNSWIEAFPRNMSSFVPSIVNIKDDNVFKETAWEFLNGLKNNDLIFLGILPYCFLLDKNVEALYAMGFKNIASTFIKRGLICNNKLYEKEFIPFQKREEKNLFKRIRFSKNELCLIEKILPLNKKALNTEKNIDLNYRFLYFLLDIMSTIEGNGIIIQSIDSNSFKVIRDFAICSMEQNHYPSYVVYVMDAIIKEKGLKGAISFLEYYLKVLPVVKVGEGFIKIQDFFRIIYDCIGMILQLRNYNIHYNIKYKFDDFSIDGELIKFHDELTDLVNNIELKYNNEEYEKIRNELLSYEYLDKEFCVLVPKDAVELAKEGETLHHCVKTYIDKVINKETIILFIRKISEVNKPFFTLEIKDNKVRQCHGFKNCNIDTVPNLKVFLKNYCKRKNIKLDSADNILAAD